MCDSNDVSLLKLLHELEFRTETARMLWFIYFSDLNAIFHLSPALVHILSASKTKVNTHFVCSWDFQFSIVLGTNGVNLRTISQDNSLWQV